MKLEIEAFFARSDDAISVYLGETFIGEIPAIAESRARHGDSSSYFESENQRIVSESIIAWVRENLPNNREP